MIIEVFRKLFNYRNARALATLGILGLIGVTLVACSGNTTTEEEAVVEPTVVAEVEPTQEVSKTIVDIAVGDGRFATLVTALQAAELDTVLSGEGPFTVFAPTDDAFGKLPEGTVESLLETIPELKNILLYHVVSGNVLAADVVSLESAVTLQGESVSISVMGDVVKINDSQVIITDLQGSNGIIHVIDTVLLPPAEQVSKTIVDIAVGDGRFATLVTALQAAELDTVLSGEGPFTVFAPTDDAFGKLPEGTVESLLETIPELKNILLYHVVSGNVLAADVVSLESAVTLQGESVSISVMGDVVKINDSQVIITDLQGSNGIIHVIDTVLLPSAE
ncbi:fasciclin domain-containing protein [Dehalococcoidia bacterium]|nr:fasciclin domain-containing protein [Dehalococcoidia bacterium]